MAESRLPNLGTVFTRIKGLIRGGAVKYEDRPLWYDVYEAFPPKLPPVAARPGVMKEVEEIFYPEDIIRAQFYKRFASPGVINLVAPAGQTLSQRVVDTFMELSKDPQIPREELFQASLDKLASQGTVFTPFRDDVQGQTGPSATPGHVRATPFQPAPLYPYKKRR